jgi:O-antigen ligase
MKKSTGNKRPPEAVDSAAGWVEKVNSFLVNGVFPVGLFLLMTGMFWLGNHGMYPKLFYWAVGLPALLSMCLSRENFGFLLQSRIFLAFLAFAAYMGLSALWSMSDDSVPNLVKLPLFVVLLFYVIFDLGRRNFDRLVATVKWSAIFAVAAAVYMLGVFLYFGGQGRFGGYGALRNPLLISHEFGVFLAWWLGVYFSEKKLFDPLPLFAILVLTTLIVLTGSRTPLMATVATVLGLVLLAPSRKGLWLIVALVLACAAAWLLRPEVFLQRGLSYRTEIWAIALQQIGEKLWFGHGLEAPMAIQLEGFPYPFSDPHNLTLAVLFAGGIVGGVLWLLMYLRALLETWEWRNNKGVLIFSAQVFYGLIAGLTEGGSFLPRPKEHWFLVWIPLALLAASVYQAKACQTSSVRQPDRKQ